MCPPIRLTIPNPFLLGAVLLAALALAPAVIGVTPAPDGHYPHNNTAEGKNALFHLTTGRANTAIGFKALAKITDAINNTAVGASALLNNVGSDNTATGALALASNTSGIANAGSGESALRANTTGNGNTAIGAQSLVSNTTGENNIASGHNALASNGTGSNNIALGASAGLAVNGGSDNIDIGNAGTAGDDRTIRIGVQGTQMETRIAGIFGATVPNGAQVIATGNGRLGTIVSSARFKEAIHPMESASDALLALEPVTFRYTKELDPDGLPQFGLVAEQVEKVNPALVVRDAEGKVHSVRYEAVNAMLLNEFLKEHRKVANHDRKAREQQGAIAELTSTAAKQELIATRQQNEIETLRSALQQQALEIERMRATLLANNPPDE